MAIDLDIGQFFQKYEIYTVLYTLYLVNFMENSGPKINTIDDTPQYSKILIYRVKRIHATVIISVRNIYNIEKLNKYITR